MIETAMRNLFEAGQRLKVSSVDVMCAAMAYHKTVKLLDVHDPYYKNILAAGALCAVFTSSRKKFDFESVIAVYYEIIYYQKACEKMQTLEYKSLEQHIPVTSKIVARVTNYETMKGLPMNYLLSYLRVLQFSVNIKNVTKLDKLRENAWMIMQIIVRDPVCIEQKPDYLAGMILLLCFLRETIALPTRNPMHWMELLLKDFQKETLYEVIAAVSRASSCR